MGHGGCWVVESMIGLWESVAGLWDSMTGFVELVTGLSISVTGLWEIVSGLYGFGFVGMDLTVVAVVLLLDFRW